MLEEGSLNGFFLICNLIYFPNHLWNSSTGSAYSLGNTSICSEDRSSKTMFTVPSKSIVQMVHVRVVVIVHKSFWKKAFWGFTDLHFTVPLKVVLTQKSKTTQNLYGIWFSYSCKLKKTYFENFLSVDLWGNSKICPKNCPILIKI